MSVALAWLLRRSPNLLLIPGTSSADLTAFVCYDKQLRDSAQALGLPVEAPA
jgi:aryl-alcohol dehydrogenase-like predicted oxidoreductase